MKFFCIMLKIRMKQILSKKGYIFIMLIFPVFIALIMAYGNSHMGEICIRAGLYAQGEMAEEVANKLTQNKDIKFNIYETIEQLEKAVAIRDVECGFILDEKLDESLITGDVKGAITLLESPSTMSKGMLQETVVAGIYEEISSEITYKLLIEKKYVKDNGDLKGWLEERKNIYYQSGNLMKIDFNNTTGEMVETNHGISYEMLNLSRGILAIFLMVATIMMGINIIDEKKEVLTIKTTLVIAVAYSFIEIMIATICIVIMNMYAQSLGFFLYELIRVIMYLICMNSIVILISSSCKDSYVLNSILPTAIIATIIFCPIIIDITSMGMGIKYISYLILPYHYLSGQGNILILLLVTIISVIGIVKKQYR